MKRSRTVSERLLAMALCLVLFIGMLPGNVPMAYAEDTGNGAEDSVATEPSAATEPSTATEPSEDTEVDAYGSVSALTGDLSISGNKTESVDITNENVIILDYVKDDGSRGADGWWVGFGITAPEAMTDAATFILGGNELSFKENQDSEGYLTVWRLVTPERISEAADGILKYTYTFYWDGTEDSKQVVNLSINAANLILRDSSGVRVYPSRYGTLSSTYGGTLTGSDTSETILTVSGVNVPYDTVTKEWHIDVTVTAPAYITEAKEGDNSFTSPTTYYLVLKPNGKNYTVDGELSGTFYWDGIEQKMSLIADNVVLVKAKQEPLVFENTSAEITQYANNGSFTNVATGGSTDKDIVYSSSNTNIAKVNSAGMVSFVQKFGEYQTGTVTITATRPGNEVYEDVTASYNLVIQNEQRGINFTTPGTVTVNYSDNNNEYTNKAYYIAFGSKKFDVTYNSSDEEIATVDASGKVTIKKVGQVQITASKTTEYNFTYTPATYTLNIVKGGQNIEIEGNDTILFNANKNYISEYTLSGIKATGETTVTSSDEAVATAKLNADGKVVVTPVAGGTFTLKVANSGDGNYNAAEVTKTITVLIEEASATFEKNGDQTVTYNDNNNVFTNALTGIQGSTEGIIYSSSDTAVATVDGSGNVTILKAGKTIISATKPADGVYGPVDHISYQLIIWKDDQTIAFAEVNPSIKVGNENYQQSAVVTSAYSGTGAITYEVVSADLDYDFSSFNRESGSFTLRPDRSGTITIKATKAADNCYNAATATYTLTVVYEPTPDPAYTIDGSLGNNGWYKGEVKIYPAEGYKISFSSANQTSKWNTFLPYNQEGITNPTIYLRNMVTNGNTAAITVENLKIDTLRPAIVDITYSEDLWPDVLEWLSFGFYNAPMTVTIQAKDDTSGVAAIYYNYNGEWLFAEPNSEGKISFEIDPEYRGKIQCYAVDNAGWESETVTDNKTLIVDSLKPGINVQWSSAVNVAGTDNTRYYAGDAVATVIITEANFFNGEDVSIDVNNSGAKFDGEWTQVTDAEGNAIENKWVNTVTLSDEADHIVTISYTDRSKNPMDTYVSETIVIDYTDPVIILEDGLEGTCTNEVVTTEITVVEHNFDASRVTVTLKGENPVVELHEVYAEWSEAKDENGEPIADTYVATIAIDGDSIYTLNVDITDPADHTDTQEASFIVEMTAPTNLEITYTDDVWGQVLEAVTFGYYNAQMTVTISAEDATSGVAAIYYNYNGEWLFAEPDSEGKISFEIDPEFKGNVKYYAADKAGNESDVTDGKATLIIDTIKPGIDVTWSDAVTVTDTARYYSGEAVATVIITEANFFDGADVMIDGAAFDGEWKAATDEKGKKIDNAWMNTITLIDEGNHAVKIAYTDRSKNEMETYSSDTIVIDYTAPIISASIDTGSSRKYFNQSQTVTITVTEKNFDASLANINIAERDSSGSSANGNVSYGEWVDEGNDVHKLTITFGGDANFTLNANCRDLAGRSDSLAEQLFTVDKTAPANMTITYSTSVLSQILSGVTFNYYDAPVTVTISAVDTTAGIESFSYQYTLNKGVSSVNKGGSGTVAATQHGNTYTARFQVPASVLAAANQFNGFISFTATDRSSNSSTETHQGSRTVVVDNISPTSTVTYNTPHQQTNNISYYAGNIEATININEANFDAGDVVVTVNKDGKAYAVNVAWVNNSADSHTGRFTLTEDGDYTVTVSYTDKSGNHMATYTSNQLTLDTTAPTIDVSNIVANSANKDAEYGFAITISDTNLDVASMNPVLMAVLRNENGLYTTTQIDLGAPVAVVAGQTYTYMVDNLPEDALYTLSYEVMDMAGNVTNTAILDDGAEYGEVQFSINRNGSTFGFGDENTENVVNQYYVYEVYDDVVIVEVNVDPIENYVVLLNGEELTEGSDYTTEQSSATDEWSKRTYVISKDLFAEEGEYSVVVSSKDKTETTAYSDVKNLSVAFVVDQTAPVLTISGLEAGGRYQTNEQTVTVIPTDDGGCLYSMKVIVLDSKGNPLTDEAGNDVSVRFDMSGEEFLKYLEENDGKVAFTVPEGLNNQVQIICNDCAVNADGLTNEYNELFDRVTVSQNQLVIFYANTPVFVGTIFGVLALLFLIIFLLKRKKKDKATA